MALIFADGFEHYGDDENKLLDGVYVYRREATLSNGQARTGTKSLHTASIGGLFSYDAIRYALPSAVSVIGLGVGLYFPHLPDGPHDNGIRLASSDNTSIASFTIEPDGSISLRQGDTNGDVLALSDPKITAASWNHIEFKITADSIVGAVEVKVNGITVMSSTNLDLGSDLISLIGFVYHNRAYYIDDLVIWDDTGDYNNDFLGPARVLTVFPDGDASPSEWTPNGATNAYECVDETDPDDNTTYIGAAEAGEEVAFTLPTLPPEIIELQAIYIPIRAALDDAGVGKIKPAIIANGTRADGDEQTLTSAYTYRGQVFEENPDTEAAFTPDDFANAILAINKTL